ncbi:cation diffusion facilitator transporter family protein [[Clostridium] bifermentans ATCC 638]|uniref:Cation diffusion facilitator transporter family protein n=1 Tax=Paraclostridium bifermentans ATCC 638 = DSM 14991 TaxID=1233171 RepID=T4VRK1_PARBF|nr:cation diffusion facilitator family transporter [Paraclostridium bifermentans]EQK43396.1 cation diffusion facilitator transporter family protein [[Clostridium] bifermentans ATCC 638] [Paraclostridium bifermentans ATCC 638 = DSM 14991]RIZ60610.1 cation transporter [Paraclostridium bifermentans]UAG17252.1 cation diffusion facilitator family transporter [Paraclostridium bifermentans]
MLSDNYKKVKQVLWIILFANIGVAILKIAIGSIIKSASMTADGFHSISDGTSNIVGLIGVSIASKPKDKDHPYGHKKFEVISGLFIGAMLLFIGGKIIFEGISKFQNPVEPTITIGSLLVLILTLIINVFVCTYEYRIGKKLNSYILISDSLHTKSDIFVSIGVLLTLVGVKLGLPAIIDPIASLVVAGFILHASYEIFKSTIDVLVDKAIVDEEAIREILKSFNEIKDVHNIRSRGSENDVHIDMHIMVEPNITVEKSHKLNHDIEAYIRKNINESAQVIIHIEPFYNKKTTDI